MPKVSVIVPFYNVEKYIEKCARSLFGQTLEDVEYIFVDDCSPDRSSQILNAVIGDYPHLSSCIKVIRMPVNSGLFVVRKVGFEASSGDFILHCDSDDWQDPRYCEMLWNKAREEDADVVVCDYYTVTDGVTKRESGCGSPDKDVLRQIISGEIPGYTWNKMVRRSLYDSLASWPVASMWEDKVLSVEWILQSRRTVFVREPLYYYRISGTGMYNSMTARTKLPQLMDNLSLIQSILAQNRDLSEYDRELSAMKATVQMQAFPLGRRDYLAIYPENRWKLLFNPLVPAAIRLGHLTHLLGIHGLSGVFRKR